MVFKSTIIRIILVFCLFRLADAASAQAGIRYYDLTLPDGSNQFVKLNSVRVGSVRLLYSKGAFADMVSSPKLWALSLEEPLNRGYDVYRILRASGYLSQCRLANAKRGVFPVIFLPSLSEGGTEVEQRRGYYFPTNPGPLVQSLPWDGQHIEALVLHEAFHYWCQSSRNAGDAQTLWFEEGAADFLSYMVSGEVPQRNVTLYFRNPRLNSPYGSSFLWWVARFEAYKTGGSLLKYLAGLHLGLRPDFIFGDLKSSASSSSKKKSAARFPFGEISTKAKADCGSGCLSVPFWRMPWGEILLHGSTRPSGYFLWHGPV